jgi:hypothetical protein
MPDRDSFQADVLTGKETAPAPQAGTVKVECRELDVSGRLTMRIDRAFLKSRWNIL